MNDKEQQAILDLIPAGHLTKLDAMVQEGVVSNSAAKEILKEMIQQAKQHYAFLQYLEERQGQ